MQQAREAARRIQCASNIKQVALAVQNYESSNKKLPAAGTYADPFSAFYADTYLRIDLKTGTNYSWIVALLPYLEEQAIYDQIDFKRKVTQNPAQPQAAQPAMLLCPSDGSRGQYFETIERARKVRRSRFASAKRIMLLTRILSTSTVGSSAAQFGYMDGALIK